MLKNQNKILKIACGWWWGKGRRHFIFKGATASMMTDFSTKLWKPKDNGMTSFKHLKKKVPIKNSIARE